MGVCGSRDAKPDPTKSKTPVSDQVTNTPAAQVPGRKDDAGKVEPPKPKDQPVDAKDVSPQIKNDPLATQAADPQAKTSSNIAKSNHCD